MSIVWTQSMIDQVRKLYPVCDDLSVLAQSLGVSLRALQVKAYRIGGLYRGTRAWTESDKALLRERYGVLPTVELSKQLGRSCMAIRMKACKMGLGFRYQFGELKGTIQEMHADGCSDADIARHLNVSRSVVAHYRRRALGLKANPLPQAARQARGEWLRQRTAAGDSPRAVATRRYAVASGWPTSITSAAQVQILNVLAASGMLSSRAIADKIGTHCRRQWSGGRCLRALIRLGLVTRLVRVIRDAKSTRDGFCLSPLALGMLEKRKEIAHGATKDS